MAIKKSSTNFSALDNLFGSSTPSDKALTKTESQVIGKKKAALNTLDNIFGEDNKPFEPAWTPPKEPSAFQKLLSKTGSAISSGAKTVASKVSEISAKNNPDNKSVIENLFPNAKANTIAQNNANLFKVKGSEEAAKKSSLYIDQTKTKKPAITPFAPLAHGVELYQKVKQKEPSTSVWKNLPQAIVDNLPFGLSEVAKSAADMSPEEIEELKNMSAGDFAKIGGQTIWEFGKGILSTPVRMAAGFSMKDKFNVPVLGEVESYGAQAKRDIEEYTNQGMSPTGAAITATIKQIPNIIFDTLLVAGVAEKVATPKEATILSGNAKLFPKSNKLGGQGVKPEPTYIYVAKDTPLGSNLHQTISQSASKYNSNLPTFLKLEYTPEGYVGSVVQVKPSVLNRSISFSKSGQANKQIDPRIISSNETIVDSYVVPKNTIAQIVGESKGGSMPGGGQVPVVPIVRPTMPGAGAKSSALRPEMVSPEVIAPKTGVSAPSKVSVQELPEKISVLDNIFSEANPIGSDISPDIQSDKIINTKNTQPSEGFVKIEDLIVKKEVKNDIYLEKSGDNYLFQESSLKKLVKAIKGTDSRISDENAYSKASVALKQANEAFKSGQNAVQIAEIGGRKLETPIRLVKAEMKGKLPEDTIANAKPAKIEKINPEQFKYAGWSSEMESQYEAFKKVMLRFPNPRVRDKMTNGDAETFKNVVKAYGISPERVDNMLYSQEKTNHEVFDEFLDRFYNRNKPVDDIDAKFEKYYEKLKETGKTDNQLIEELSTMSVEEIWGKPEAIEDNKLNSLIKKTEEQIKQYENESSKIEAETPASKEVEGGEGSGKNKDFLKTKTQKEVVKEAVKDKEKSIKEVSEETGILEPNVRRILGMGAKEGTFERVDSGVYRLRKDGKDIAVIHAADSVEALPRLADSGFKADMVFLDIPYDLPSVKGGNRGIKYETISIKDFEVIVDSISQIARTDNTPVVHMFSQADSSIVKMEKYNQVLFNFGFKPVAKGEWQKTFKNGAPVTNVRGQIAKPEGIILFSKSGKINKDEIPNLSFRLIRPKGYQTEKPAEMLKAIIEATTKKGDVVLDPFAGSGVTLAESVKLGRTAVGIEKSESAIENFIKPRIEGVARGKVFEKKTPGADNYLSVEAKKFKSADEFINSQINAYHGTPNKEFDEFKLGMRNNSENETNGLGVWVTPQAAAAKTFSNKIEGGLFGYGSTLTDVGGTVMPVSLRLKNPKIYTSTKGMESILDEIEVLEKAKPSFLRTSPNFESDYEVRQAAIKEREIISAKIEKLRKKYRRDAFEKFMDDRDKFAKYISNGAKWEDRYIALEVPETNRKFINYLKQQGHDGIIIKGTEYDAKGAGLETIDQIVAFDPKDVLTRAQLRKIWEEANKKTNPFEKKLNLTLKTFDWLEGKETVSKQYIQDLTNRGDIKQVERDIIRESLETEGDKVNVSDFIQKVQNNLLPLKRIDLGETGDIMNGDGNLKYEFVALPGDIRGSVANYSEVIYESPVKTSAGSIHFRDTGTEKYFGHVRYEDMAIGAKKTGVDLDGNPIYDMPPQYDNTELRRIIEVQTDLYQKGRLESEFGQFSVLKGNENRISVGEAEMIDRLNKRKNEANKLQQYNDPSAHFRLVREEVKNAANQGILRLQFPTGETAMKIEGLAGRMSDVILDTASPIQTFEKGALVTRTNDASSWVIVMKNGNNVAGISWDRLVRKNPELTIEDVSKNPDKYASNDLVETFVIGGSEVDTSNPIYKFYQKDLGRYLTSKYGAKVVTDENGVSWFEMNVKPEYAERPVEAFQKTLGRKWRPNISVEQAKSELHKMFSKSDVVLITREFGTPYAQDRNKSWGVDMLGNYHDGVIKVVMSNGKVNNRTIYHESFHHYINTYHPIIDAGNLINQAYRENKGLADKLYEGYENSPDVRGEELLADWFADYVSGKRTFIGRIEAFFKSIIRRIKELFTKLKAKEQAKDLFEIILSGKSKVMEIAPVKKNTTVFMKKNNAPKPSELSAEEYHTLDKINEKVFSIKTKVKVPENIASTLIFWNDKRPITMSRETMDRNLDDVAGDVSPAVKDFLTEKIKLNETMRATFTTALRTEIENYVVKQLGIKKGSDLSSLVQKFGEGEINQKELMEKTDKWPQVIEAAEYLRKVYDNMIDKWNGVRESYGYQPIPKRQDYFRHGQFIHSISDRLGMIMSENELPTSISGITAMFNPGTPFSTAALKRTGVSTDYDAVAGIDNYIDAVSRSMFHTDSVQRGRSLEKVIRKTYEIIEENNVEINKRNKDRIDQNSNEKLEATLPNVELTNFVANLNEYTNLISGKKAQFDRAFESLFGRSIYGVFNQLRSRTSANMIGGNISSAITNFIPVTQLLATTNKVSVARGLAEVPKGISDSRIIDGQKSGFLTRRFTKEQIGMSPWDKTKAGLNYMFKAVDLFTSRWVVASKYYENLSKGMTRAEALRNADNYAGQVITDRSIGQLPNLFGIRTMGVFTQFQTEINNQWSFITKDMSLMSKGNKLKLLSMFIQFFLYSYLFNELYEKLIGRRPAIDPIYDAMTLAGQTVEGENKPLTKRVGLTLESTAGNLPFTGGITGGRLPISAGMPDILGALKGETSWQKELSKPMFYLAFPVAGGQVKKTYEGLTAFNEGGSYSKAGLLQFPIDQTPENLIKTGVFGKYSTGDSKLYYGEERSPLGKNQTKEYKRLLENNPSQARPYYDRIIDKR